MAGFRGKRKKTCYFSDNKIEKIDWTNVELLKKFGLCAENIIAKTKEAVKLKK